MSKEQSNPIIDLLTRYKEMSEGSIISHINDWWHDMDGHKIFEDSKNSGLIEQDKTSHLWHLSKGHESQNHNYIEGDGSNVSNCKACGDRGRSDQAEQIQTTRPRMLVHDGYSSIHPDTPTIQYGLKGYEGFKEEEHPRDAGGKFSTKGSAKGGSKTSSIPVQTKSSNLSTLQGLLNKEERPEHKKVIQQLIDKEKQKNPDYAPTPEEWKPNENADKVEQELLSKTPKEEKYFPKPSIPGSNDEHSSFLTSSGLFARDPSLGDHYSIAKKYGSQLGVDFPEDQHDPNATTNLNKFILNSGMIRTTFNGKQFGFQILGNPTSSQLKTIRDIENSGYPIEWEIRGKEPTMQSVIYGGAAGDGYRDLVKELRNSGQLGGKPSVQSNNESDPFMAKEDPRTVANIISNARNSGVPDQDIADTLSDNGVRPNVMANALAILKGGLPMLEFRSLPKPSWLLSSESEDHPTYTKDQMGYVDAPPTGPRCGTCSWRREPNRCGLVVDRKSPNINMKSGCCNGWLSERMAKEIMLSGISFGEASLSLMPLTPKVTSVNSKRWWNNLPTATKKLLLPNTNMQDPPFEKLTKEEQYLANDYFTGKLKGYEAILTDFNMIFELDTPYYWNGLSPEKRENILLQLLLNKRFSSMNWDQLPDEIRAKLMSHTRQDQQGIEFDGGANDIMNATRRWQEASMDQRRQWLSQTPYGGVGLNLLEFEEIRKDIRSQLIPIILGTAQVSQSPEVRGEEDPEGLIKDEILNKKQMAALPILNAGIKYDHKNDALKLQQKLATLQNESLAEYDKFVATEMRKINENAPPNRIIGLMAGRIILNATEASFDGGLPFHGILAYAGVSHNRRLYLPEELARGDGQELPLIFNHATPTGIESELSRLPPDIREKILNHEKIVLGRVRLEWKPEELTLFYKAIVDHPFFQQEIREGRMSVSLGMLFEDSADPICDVYCYTLVKQGMFQEVSLVYHPGFPVASIAVTEARLRSNAMEVMMIPNDRKGLFLEFAKPRMIFSSESIPHYRYKIDMESLNLIKEEISGPPANTIPPANMKDIRFKKKSDEEIGGSPPESYMPSMQTVKLKEPLENPNNLKNVKFKKKPNLGIIEV